MNCTSIRHNSTQRQQPIRLRQRHDHLARQLALRHGQLEKQLEDFPFLIADAIVPCLAACTDTFADAGEALVFISAQGGAWVVKQNDHQSHLNYVGVMDDGSDVCGVLESYQRLGIRNLSVQRRLHGVEIGVGRYFNGRDWVGPIEINQEHKGLLNGELGPKTGEMGTLMWYSESSRLFDVTLGHLRDHLRRVDFRGDIALNCFVDGNKIHPIEATARFGCPSTYLQSALHHTSWTELLCAVADGRSCNVKVREGYAIGLTLAVPPFPYRAEQIPGVSSAGLPMQLRGPLTTEETHRLHLEGVAMVQDEDGENNERILLTHSLGYAAFVTGTGATVEAAQQAAYALAGKIVIPKVMYRTDIGDRFLNGDLPVDLRFRHGNSDCPISPETGDGTRRPDAHCNERHRHMHYRTGDLPSVGRTMTTLRCLLFWAITLMLIISGQLARAENVTGEIQVVSIASKDRSIQRSLTGISIYVEYELANEVSAFVVGYHDQEFRSATVGLARKIGDWQMGFGLGHAAFDDMSHQVINPWAYYANDNYKGYLHYESHRNGSTHSHFMKGYALKHFGAISLGAHAEMDFGVGPRIEAKLADGLKVWGVVPVGHRPKEGAMKAMIGLSVES